MGVTRFIFAIFVVVSHLADNSFFSHWGVFAVTGFYVFSGYLITRVLVEVYRFQPKAFWENRFLRLFPMYYFVAFITLLLILYVFPDAANYHPAYAVSNRWRAIFGNLLLFPFDWYEPSFRLVPPTWSVGVELINYFFLWLYIARSKRTAMISFVVASSIHIWIYCFSNGGWRVSYAPSYAVLLPFTLGSVIYYFGSKIQLQKYWGIISGLFIANLIVTGLMGGASYIYFQEFFYCNIVIVSLLVAAIRNVRIKWDKFFGNLAYPVFLTHWLIGLVLVHVFNLAYRGLEILAFTLPATLVTSFLLVRLQEVFIERVRDRIRSTHLMKLGKMHNKFDVS